MEKGSRKSPEGFYGKTRRRLISERRSDIEASSERSDGANTAAKAAYNSHNLIILPRFSLFDKTFSLSDRGMRGLPLFAYKSGRGEEALPAGKSLQPLLPEGAEPDKIVPSKFGGGKTMELRRCRLEDLEQVAELFATTILTVNRRDYTDT